MHLSHKKVLEVKPGITVVLNYLWDPFKVGFLKKCYAEDSEVTMWKLWDKQLCLCVKSSPLAPMLTVPSGRSTHVSQQAVAVTEVDSTWGTRARAGEGPTFFSILVSWSGFSGSRQAGGLDGLVGVCLGPTGVLGTDMGLKSAHWVRPENLIQNGAGVLRCVEAPGKEQGRDFT